MELEVGTKIGRYEIRSLLGKGGMGEVYRAFDARLEREVALKFLKSPDDPEKLRRFRQEAKAISSLNHPNIITIYEVEDFDDYNFIVSEIVNGENLRELISVNNLPLEETIKIAVQVGNALSAAHAVGIVHRDIKPENIMVSHDGFVKVLDFGLAKFVSAENFSAEDSNAPTASVINTRAGVIIGTINYMSPEQLRGKTIDGRTDIWSLGVVLFEMLTCQRPFSGESSSDVIAAILQTPAPLVSQIKVEIPPEIEKIVNQCLAKETENRFQTAKEFVEALRNFESKLRSGEVSSVAEKKLINLTQTAALPTNPNQTSVAETDNLSGVFIAGKRVQWRVVGLAAFIMFLAVTVGGWLYIKDQRTRQLPAKQMKTRRLTTTGNIVNGAISPDGKFTVYVQTNNGQQSLWLRQTEENVGQKLIPAAAESYAGLTFTPDGKWIYFTAFDERGIGKLKRIQLLGGTPQEIARDVDSTAAFAFDGEKLAFIRSNPNEGIDRIVLLNSDGSGERVLKEKKRPEFYTTSDVRQSLAWSPDGKTIAYPYGNSKTDGEFMSVGEVNVETGAEKPLTDAKWHRVGRVLWTKNEDELLVTVLENGAEAYQIHKISRSTGQVGNVTGEANDYYNLTLNKDATLLLGVAYNKTSNIYVASLEQPNQANLLAGGGYDGIGGVQWTTDGRIVYVSMENGSKNIWIKNADGSQPQQLTFNEAADESPQISNDGKYIVFVSSRKGVPHLWRMNVNGSDLKQLTDRGGENLPSITPDGKFVVYSKNENRPLLWKISIEGGEPLMLTDKQTNTPAVSPDGKTVACLWREETIDSPVRLALVSADSGEILKTFKLPGAVSFPDLPATLRWMPEGRAIAYIATINGTSNIWTQAVSDNEPKKITDFNSDRIFSFDISRDGKQLIYARGAARNDLVLIENF